MDNILIKTTFIYKDKVLYALTTILFIFTFYILFFFTPHGVNYQEQRISFFFTCIVHSLVAALLFMLMPYLVRKKLKNEAGHWNILFEFLYFVCLLVLIGIGNYLVRDVIYINENNWSARYLWKEIRNGFSVGLVVGAMVTSIRAVLELRNNLKKANSLLSSLAHTKPSPAQTKRETLLIEGAVKSEKFEIQVDQLFYAKSSGNYIDIFIEKEAEIIRLTKRLSLSAFLHYFADYKHIMRIHKSYIVNIEKITNVSGNAAGLFLNLKNIENTTLPVSRKYLKDFEESVQVVKT